MVKFEDFKNQIECFITKKNYENEGWDLDKLKQEKPWLPIFCDSLYKNSDGVYIKDKNEFYEFRDFDDLPLYYQKKVQNTFYTYKDALEYILEKKIDDSLYQEVDVKYHSYIKYKDEIVVTEEKRFIWCVEYDTKSSQQLYYFLYEYLGYIPVKQEFKDGIWNIYNYHETKQ